MMLYDLLRTTRYDQRFCYYVTNDFDRRFQLEDEELIYPDDKVFRWDMLDKELNYRWF